jgi:hypothetical protein
MMIRHIVCWKFLDHAEGASRAENLRKAKFMLESLPEKIPGILSLEVGIDSTQGTASFDLALNGTFPSASALEAYQRHPEHVNVVRFLRLVQSDKMVVDYELSGP